MEALAWITDRYHLRCTLTDDETVSEKNQHVKVWSLASGRCLARGRPYLSCLNGVADGQKEAAGFPLPATDEFVSLVRNKTSVCWLHLRSRFLSDLCSQGPDSPQGPRNSPAFVLGTDCHLLGTFWLWQLFLHLHKWHGRHNWSLKVSFCHYLV